MPKKILVDEVEKQHHLIAKLKLNAKQKEILDEILELERELTLLEEQPYNN